MILYLRIASINLVFGPVCTDAPSIMRCSGAIINYELRKRIAHMIAVNFMDCESGFPPIFVGIHLASDVALTIVASQTL